MRKLILFAMIFLPIGWIFGLEYDPGDLINAVKRSQVITELFMERWSVMENSISLEDWGDPIGLLKKEKTNTESEKIEKRREEKPKRNIQEAFYYINRGSFSKYMDLFFHGENITGYPINTPYGKYDLTLFRIFGSSIFRFADLIDLGITQWGFAFSAAGYRYGMYKEIKLKDNSGTADAGNFTVKDYLYTQVFDDLIVFTNLFKGFGYIHTGILLNQQVDPGFDGMIGTADDTKIKSKSRIFLDSNLLGFLFVNLGYNDANDRAEFLTTKIDAFSLLQLTSLVDKRELWPDLYLGYIYTNTKTDLQAHPSLHVGFMELFYTYYNAFYTKVRTEFFLKGRNEAEKEYTVKQLLGEIGFRFETMSIIANPEKWYQEKDEDLFFSYYLIAGLSYLTESRTIKFGNTNPEVYGLSIGIKLNMATSVIGGSLEARISRNYSAKLYNLIEAYDHWIYEVSAQIGF